jgi:hypothetical protein
MKDERSMEIRNGPGDHFFDLGEMKVGVITFSILGLGSCLLTVGTCRQNKLLYGVSFDDHSLAKRMKDGCTKSLVKPQVQGSMITKVQGVHLLKECTWSK